MSAQFDHLVVGIRSLQEGIGQFRHLVGVEAAAGGTHPGRGTENALVSLGPHEYLELIAPQAEARLSDTDARLRELDRLTIVTWAVAVDNADSVRETLKKAGFATTLPQHGTRVTPSNVIHSESLAHLGLSRTACCVRGLILVRFVPFWIGIFPRPTFPESPFERHVPAAIHPDIHVRTRKGDESPRR